MKNLINYLTIILFAGVMVACGEDEEVGPITEDQAKSVALSSISGTTGTVTSSDVDTTTNDVLYYDVDVVTGEGAVIEFEYYLATGELKSIEGDSGPFDYEVNPGMGLITFSQAKTIALESLTAQPGEVLRWDLEFDNSSNIWVYTFEVLDANSEDQSVRINAATGAIL